MRSSLSDALLARRAAAGDRRAFGAIYRRYHQDLYRFCLSMVGRPEDAQEALQNTMVKALRALPGEKRSIQLRPWLYRVAHNESIDLLRRRREGVELERVPLSAGEGPAETIARRQRLGQLLDDLGELPDRQRSALVMRELAGLGYAEIGASIGASPAVARQAVYEARLSLRDLEAGREMSCEEVTRVLSDADGRVARRRDIRAHLRSCPDCRAFRDAIPRRRGDLAALAPLPVGAAASILHGLAGGQAGGGASAAAGAAAGKAAGASLALKGAAAVAVVAAVGVTTADRAGVIHLGLGARGNGESVRRAGAASPESGSALRRRPAERRRADSAAARRHGGATATSGAGAEGGANPAGRAAPASGELPAASSHGQETAASHGGGRANAGSRSHAPPHPASGAHAHPSPPPHPETGGAKAEQPSTPSAPPGEVGPDNAPTPPLQQAEGPPNEGASVSPGAHAPQEER